MDIYELPLELARFADPEGEDPLVTFLEGRLKSHPVDLVVPIGRAGVQFAARHRERLFPDTPVLALAVGAADGVARLSADQRHARDPED